MQEMKTGFKSHYMKHKQAILKARALYYAKHRNKVIAVSRALNAKKPNQQLGVHTSIIMPSTEPSIVQACIRGMK